MPNEEIKLQAPIEVEVKVGIINDAGQTGEVTFGLGSGIIPDAEEIRKVAGQVEEQVADAGYRLMTKREFFDQLIFRKTGSQEKFALPGGDDWDE